jgi:hypothetical protein
VSNRQTSVRCDQPAERVSSGESPNLDIHVIFTNVADTQATLKAAGKLARDLRARVTILAAQVVPYPLPIESPPVPIEFTERTLRLLASEQDVEATVKVYLCRDRRETIRQALQPDSVVVIGGRKRWWPTAEQSLAGILKRDGHRVVLVDPVER